MNVSYRRRKLYDERGYHPSPSVAPKNGSFFSTPISENAPILAVLLLFVLLIILFKSAKRRRKRDINYATAYQAVNILTSREWKAYLTLRNFAEQRGLIICPKVRLADIIEPKSGPDYMRAFGKIKSKHVDFVFPTETSEFLQF